MLPGLPGIHCGWLWTSSPARSTRKLPPMNANHESAQKHQDARALPAPPLALWTFGILLVASAVWAAIHA